MYGEATMNVMFDYVAYEIKEGSILHNCKVLTQAINEVPFSHTCSSGSFITVTADVYSKVVTIGMVVPVKVICVSYPQNTNNMISVYGEVLRPQLFENIEYFIGKPSNEELKDAAMKISSVQENALRVLSLPRSGYFRSFIYPHKILVKNLSILDIISGETLPSNFGIRINDKCDATNFEYVKIQKRPCLVRVSFSEIVDFMIKCANELWFDIENLSKTYESDDMFKKHEPIFAYYENSKDNDNSQLFSEEFESKDMSGNADLDDNVI
jgi:hypothetical protein